MVKKARKTAKTHTRKKKTSRTTAAKANRSFKARLESEFSQAVSSARAYVANPERLRGLANEAARKAATLPKETFKESWAYLQTMLRLIRAYYRGEYRDVPMSALLIIIAAIVYLVNPLDLIPDWVPGVGLLDDAFIVAFAVRQTKPSLDNFMTWETTRV
jgi:uncharacterized membrane protein YkvA (DUF1232 family)